MEDAEIVVVGIVSLIVAGFIRNTLLVDIIGQFYATDTSNWGWATVLLWEQIPTIVIAALIFAPIINILSNFE